MRQECHKARRDCPCTNGVRIAEMNELAMNKQKMIEKMIHDEGMNKRTTNRQTTKDDEAGVMTTTTLMMTTTNKMTKNNDVDDDKMTRTTTTW